MHMSPRIESKMLNLSILFVCLFACLFVCLFHWTKLPVLLFLGSFSLISGFLFVVDDTSLVMACS